MEKQIQQKLTNLLFLACSQRAVCQKSQIGHSKQLFSQPQAGGEENLIDKTHASLETGSNVAISENLPAKQADFS
jgi:hypothetical protein